MSSACLGFDDCCLCSVWLEIILHAVFYRSRVNVTEDGKKALVTLAKGDMRKSLNILQARFVPLSFSSLLNRGLSDVASALESGKAFAIEFVLCEKSEKCQGFCVQKNVGTLVSFSELLHGIR